MASALILTGPTASGKSALALEFAGKFSQEVVIINADAVQLYREIPILAGTPTPAESAQAAHYGYNLLEANEQASAGVWLALVTPIISSALAQGKLPIIVGGTGLYIKALVAGLAPIPAIDPAVQAAVELLHAAQGQEALYSVLQQEDPAAAAHIKTNDRLRTARALAVWRSTSKSMVMWRDAPRSQVLPAVNWQIYALLPEREILYQKSATRFNFAFANGAVDEVRAVLQKYSPESIRLRALGFTAISKYLQHELAEGQAISVATQDIRHYIKRQFTWIRHQLPGSITLPSADPLGYLLQHYAKLQNKH